MHLLKQWYLFSAKLPLGASMLGALSLTACGLSSSKDSPKPVVEALNEGSEDQSLGYPCPSPGNDGPGYEPGNGGPGYGPGNGGPGYGPGNGGPGYGPGNGGPGYGPGNGGPGYGPGNGGPGYGPGNGGPGYGPGNGGPGYGPGNGGPGYGPGNGGPGYSGPGSWSGPETPIFYNSSVNSRNPPVVYPAGSRVPVSNQGSCVPANQRPSVPGVTTSARVSFNQLAPIISKSCGGANCHSSGSRYGAFVGNQPAVDGAKSRIYDAVISGRMPKYGELSAQDKALVLNYTRP